MLVIFGLIIIFVVADSIRGYLYAKNKQKYLSQLVISLPLIILALFLFGPFFILSPIKLGYSTAKEGGITLYYAGNRIDFARDVMTKTQQAAKINEDFFRMPINEKILLARTPLDMLRFGSYPQAGGTGSILGINVLERKISFNLIAHEMSHRNLKKMASALLPTVPTWFDEGLASYLGKMDYYRKPDQLKIDLKDGRYRKDILSLRGPLGSVRWLAMNFWLPNRDSALLYGQVYLMTKYLFDKYGNDKIYDFVTSLKKNSFESSFQQTFGLTEEQFHQQFINYIENYHD